MAIYACEEVEEVSSSVGNAEVEEANSVETVEAEEVNSVEITPVAEAPEGSVELQEELAVSSEVTTAHHLEVDAETAVTDEKDASMTE